MHKTAMQIQYLVFFSVLGLNMESKIYVLIDWKQILKLNQALKMFKP